MANEMQHSPLLWPKRTVRIQREAQYRKRCITAQKNSLGGFAKDVGPRMHPTLIAAPLPFKELCRLRRPHAIAIAFTSGFPGLSPRSCMLYGQRLTSVAELINPKHLFGAHRFKPGMA
jgi:hypothetical protein